MSGKNVGTPVDCREFLWWLAEDARAKAASVRLWHLRLRVHSPCLFIKRDVLLHLPKQEQESLTLL